uniref:Uncharacterized protein n=1 Tax=Nelumbo nucifera TaxID=4432 RepID=A0A822ZE07_NELNU|nr:TPA_asm: hypothetical protein HUJ06_000960 [Nelumbo nucifera]
MNFYSALSIILQFFSLCFQPALLYIVPAVIGFVAIHCIWNGEVKPVCSTPICFSSVNLFILFTLFTLTYLSATFLSMH